MQLHTRAEVLIIAFCKTEICMFIKKENYWPLSPVLAISGPLLFRIKEVSKPITTTIHEQ